ncbi:MAG: hypothetical protein ACYC6Y_05195 [Thermoguttaceae bacterium]
MIKKVSLGALALIMAAATGFAREPVATAMIYGPVDASREAHARAEAARLHAIDRQRQTIDLLTWYGAYRPGYPQLPPSYLMGRGQRRYERSLGRSPLAVPFPEAPGHAYPHGGKVVPVLPYLNISPQPVQQPAGHRTTWTGPNSYVYQPLYASGEPGDESAGSALEGEESIPTPAPAPAPAPIPSETIPTPFSLPETIPTPPSIPEAIPTPQPLR